MVRLKYDTDITLDTHSGAYDLIINKEVLMFLINTKTISDHMTSICIHDYSYQVEWGQQGWVEKLFIEDNKLKMVVCVLDDYYVYMKKHDILLLPIFIINVFDDKPSVIKDIDITLHSASDIASNARLEKILGENEL